MLEARRSGLYKEFVKHLIFCSLHCVDKEIFLTTSMMELENLNTHLWNKYELTLRSWTDYLISLFFSFLLWKMGIVAPKSCSAN